MQYTASSFAQPLTDLFALRAADAAAPGRRRRACSRTPRRWPPRRPTSARERLYAPVFAGIGRGLAALRWLQHGRVQLYVLYIALTLLVLLVWKLG